MALCPGEILPTGQIRPRVRGDETARLHRGKEQPTTVRDARAALNWTSRALSECSESAYPSSAPSFWRRQRPQCVFNRDSLSLFALLRFSARVPRLVLWSTFIRKNRSDCCCNARTCDRPIPLFCNPLIFAGTTCATGQAAKDPSQDTDVERALQKLARNAD